MSVLNNNYLLIIIGIIAIIVEIILGAATGFDLLLIGIIFIISGGLGMLVGSFNLALVTVTALSFLYLIFGRKFVKKQLSIETKSTNVDNLYGKKAIVIKKISSHHSGQVKVQGEVWRAEADVTLEEGKEVTVQSVSGVTLKVQ